MKVIIITTNVGQLLEKSDVSTLCRDSVNSECLSNGRREDKQADIQTDRKVGRQTD